MLYVCNSFSLGMLPELRLSPDAGASSIRVEPVTAEQARAYMAKADDDGYIAFSARGEGRVDSARIFAGGLCREVAAHRVGITLNVSDRFLISQYLGPRLPEGATELPAGARIAWLIVSLEEAQ